MSFSTDGRYLLTGGRVSGRTALEAGRRAGRAQDPRGGLLEPEGRWSERHLRGDPAGNQSDRNGHSNGQVNLWSWKDGKARLEVPQLVGRTSSRAHVKSLTFLADGKKLAASGEGHRSGWALWKAIREPSRVSTPSGPITSSRSIACSGGTNQQLL